MMGKYFLFAVIGISLVQAGNNELFMTGYKKICAMEREFFDTFDQMREKVRDDRNVIAAEPPAFSNKSERVRTQGLYSLQILVYKMQNKTKGTPNPEPIIKCIKLQSFMCKEKIEKHMNVFKNVDLNKAVQVHAPKVESVDQILGKISTQDIMKFYNAETQLHECKDIQCVNNTVDKYKKWLEGTAHPTLNNMVRPMEDNMGDFSRFIKERYNFCSDSVKNATVAAKAGMEQCFK